MVVALPLALAVVHPAVRAADDAGLSARKAEAEKAFKEHVAPFVKDLCLECHGNRRTKGGLNLEPAVKHPGSASASRKWIKAFANVHAHDMPPDRADQPLDKEREQFLESLKIIKYLSDKDPGPFVIRRLTRTEYGNTLRDLLGVDPSVVDELPKDVPGEGYLNSLSPMQTEQYLGIADKVLDQILAPEGKSATAWEKRWLGEFGKGEDLREEARKVATPLARKAFRRPLAEGEVDTLVSVFDLGQSNDLGAKASLRLMLKALLVSPQFLFITPSTEAASGPKIVPLDDHQLASRLSYFLWSTMPDEELLGLAEMGTLHEPEVLRSQVKRMIEDPRSRALFDSFGAQWLGLGVLEEKTFDAKKYPQMTGDMRQAMYDEVRLFFGSLLRENWSVVDLINSDVSFLNGPLASLYGVEGEVTGGEMRKVRLKDPNRGGILGMPGILAATSFPNRTSPVLRGVWVLERVLGEHVPPAPADVPTLEQQDSKSIDKLTLRQRTELHRTEAVCANCHQILDPIGFGLENYDAIGRWRTKDDAGGSIDASGELPGGGRFSSPRELKALIAARKDDLARNLTERLLAFALCRQLKGYDEIVVDQLMVTIAADGYRMQTILAEVVTSYPFLNRRIQD